MVIKKEKIIASSPLFKGLPVQQIHEISEIAVEKKYLKDSSIFLEGDEGIGFYLVAEGKVKIFKVSAEGKEHILHIFGPGEPFAETPGFYGQPFPANASTLVKSKLLFIPRRNFIRLVTDTPALALNMLAVLSLRLRRFATKIEYLSLKEVPARLAFHLLYLAGEQNNEKKVQLDIPKGQLASLLGTIPETLSRIFLKMTEQGLIKVQGRTILLLDIEGLQDV
jgi:CRP/FNR family transcriptional regulator